MSEIIKSIAYSNEEIIMNILRLHVPNHLIDCDPTYSKGVFYKGNIPEPKYKYDINPIVDGVIKADCRNLPLPNGSIGCIMFDPPFLATTGKSLTSNSDNNLINKRFGVYPSESELHQFYVDSMVEFYRVLKENGVLIFKCQDKISGGKQYMTHCFIYNEAVRIGYYPKDIFILLAKSRIVADWQKKYQKNSRKYHSYFWVLIKNSKRITYISSK